MKFARLKRVCNNVIKINPDIIFVTISQDERIEKFIIDLNIVDQIFDEGIQANDRPLSSTNATVGYYSQTTEQLNEGRTFTVGGKTKTKEAGDPYFLIDTGDFFTTFDVQFDSDGFTIEADEVKPNVDMIEEYGANILGLTNESKSKLAQEVLPLVVKEVRRILLS